MKNALVSYLVEINSFKVIKAACLNILKSFRAVAVANIIKRDEGNKKKIIQPRLTQSIFLLNHNNLKTGFGTNC